MSTTIERIDAVISEPTRRILFNACKDTDDLEHSAKLILDHTEVNLYENLLISMVKVCIITRNLAASKKHDATIELIRNLNLDEDTRKFLYECLFDKKGLDGVGLKIFRRPS